MKQLSKICRDLDSSWLSEKPILCDYITLEAGATRLKVPTMSNEMECQLCRGKNHYTPFFDPKISNERVWLCANTFCRVYSDSSLSCQYIPTTQPPRSIVWPEFCEMFGIGNIHHQVKFEDIKQSEGKISFMRNFAFLPKNIILMQGTPGTGKTFSAMGICELFTRTNVSCAFTTQRQLLEKWMGKSNEYIEKLTKISLLVIDDFGTMEPTPGFLSFFMDLINTRLQYDNRGTVITTNLDDKSMSKYCGEALSDRLSTGQIMIFEGTSRRKKNIL